MKYLFIILFLFYSIAANAQAIGGGGTTYTGISPIVVGTSSISCPTCGSSITGTTLGTSATHPAPIASNSDTETGLYTTGAGSTNFTSAGTQVGAFTATGLNLVAGDSYEIGNQNALSFPSNAISNGNIALGSSSLASIGSTDLYNVALGYNAAPLLSGQDYSVSVGAFSNYSYTTQGTQTAAPPLAIGYRALYADQTDTEMTAVGYLVLSSCNGNCGESTGMGWGTLRTLSGASSGGNTGVGVNNMGALIAGANNSSYGVDAIRNATAGTSNTALGAGAMKQTLGGTNNTAIGNNALGSWNINSTNPNSQNTAVGSYALSSNAQGTSGTAATFLYSTGMGYTSLWNVTSGNYNTAYGWSSGQNVTTGGANILLGPNTAPTLVTGSNNIAIGSSADVPTSSTSNWLNIGGAIQGTMNGASTALAIGTSVVSTGTAFDMGSLTGSVLLPVSTGTTGLAGMLRYNTGTTSVQVYQGSTWVSLGGGATYSGSFISGHCLESNVTGTSLNIVDAGAGCGGTFNLSIGTSATVASPQVTGDAGTGLYSSGAQHVDIATGGVQSVDIGTGLINVVSATGALQIDSVNAIMFPSDSTGEGASIAIGPSALTEQNSLASTAFFNTAIGYQTLPSTGLTTASIENTAVGAKALFANTTGHLNTGLGYNAGSAITTGVNDICIGVSACSGASTVNNIVAIGNSTLVQAGSGANNTAVGASALNGTTGADNTALGNNAGSFIQAGASNVAVGWDAMQGVSGTRISGSFNTAVGQNSLLVAQGGVANNTAIGYDTLTADTTGSSNAALGVNAGLLVTTGSSNLIVGPNVASTVLTTGSNNILIGVSSAITTGGASNSNEIHIGGTGGDFITVTGTGTNTTEAVTINGTLSLPGLTNADTGDYVCYNAGAIEYDATACLASLKKYKENIKSMSGALSELMELQPVSYTYKKNFRPHDRWTHIGFIAEDVEKIDKRLAAYKYNGELESVNYNHITVLNTSALQEMQKEIDQLREAQNLPPHVCNVFCKVRIFFEGL